MLKSQKRKSTFSYYHPFTLIVQIYSRSRRAWRYSVYLYFLSRSCVRFNYRLHKFYEPVNARSTRRSKEVGIRKVVGAARTQLIRQFLMESILFVSISLLVALVLAQLLLPSFNEISGKS